MSSLLLDRLNALTSISQRKLTNILDKIPGKKNLIIESSLFKPLDKFVGASVLRNHGVEKIYKLDKNGCQESNSTVVYIVRADLLMGKTICNQINSCQPNNSDLKFHIVFIPKLLTSIDLLFEEEGLCGRVEFHAFSWELIQLDSKILSFETPKLYKQLFMDNDQSFLTSIAKSLWSFNHVFGTPPLSIFHGKYSNLVSSLLECWTEENGASNRCDSDIGCMIIMDRDVDYASVLLMPGTYTGLMCEVMPITTGVVELKPPKNEKKELPISMNLTSNDEIYNQIKNKHFSGVNLYLKQKANDLISEKNKRVNMGINEMKNFVESQLGKLRSESAALANHFNICEKICIDMGQKFETIHNCQSHILYGDNKKEILTEIAHMISVSDEMFFPLRLICLHSLAQNGFSTEESNTIIKQFLHSYGHKYLTMFYSLEKSGLFTVHQSSEEISTKIANKVAQVVPFPKKNSFQTMIQKMKLIPDASNTDLKNPQDPGYVFGGAYIPLIAQIVTYLIKKEISLNELVKSLPSSINGKPETKLMGNVIDGTPEINPRCIMVYIVGGITYAEIAALQFIEARMGCRILCCGSNIISAKNLLQTSFSH